MAVYIARRIIISVLLFFMFIVTNICNKCLNITIVSMVDRNTSLSNNTTFGNNTQLNDNKLHWSNLSIATVQGAFFWGYCITKLPGGLLSRLYGSKRLLTTSTFIAGVTSCVFPTAAKIHPMFASVIRAILGLANGVDWAAAIHMGAIWIPKCERSTFSNIYQGSGIAVVIFSSISGFIIDRYGWESVFYLSGTLCFIWLMFWYHYAYDSPNTHPTISCEEKAYPEDEMKGTLNDISENKSLSLIPWKLIFKSPAFWGVAIFCQGTLWCTLTLELQLPKYFINARNVDIKTSGIMVGLPGICMLLSGSIFGYYMDNCIKQQKCSITRARKIATITGKIIPGIILLILSINTHSDYLISVLLITIFYVFNGSVTSAGLANLNDITPNFAGVIYGIIHTFIAIPGILSPLIYSYILSSNPNNGWFWIFITIAFIDIFTGAIFMVFGDGKVQSWNEVEKKNNHELEGEMEEFMK